jgi:hypothetical protein
MGNHSSTPTASPSTAQSSVSPSLNLQDVIRHPSDDIDLSFLSPEQICEGVINFSRCGLYSQHLALLCSKDQPNPTIDLSHEHLHPSLTNVDLSYNQLSVLPPFLLPPKANEEDKSNDISCPYTLRILNLASNKLFGNSEVIFLTQALQWSLCNLTILNLSYNGIGHDLPLHLFPSTLQYLCLRGNRPLTQFTCESDDTVHSGYLPSLVHLDVSECSLKSFSIGKKDIQSLQYLNLSLNLDLRTISIDSAPCLTELDLHRIPITSFPLSLSNCKFTYLNLSRCALKELPLLTDIAVQSIYIMDLSINHITQFPELKGFHSLTSLSLNGFDVNQIPNEWKMLHSLTWLEIR